LHCYCCHAARYALRASRSSLCSADAPHTTAPPHARSHTQVGDHDDGGDAQPGPAVRSYVFRLCARPFGSRCSDAIALLRHDRNVEDLRSDVKVQARGEVSVAVCVCVPHSDEWSPRVRRSLHAFCGRKRRCKVTI
jgi:hypothetical protein